MKPEMLKTESDYEAALAYVDTLMDAEPGSPEEEELGIFAGLVEAYEQAHYPIDLPDCWGVASDQWPDRVCVKRSSNRSGEE